MPTSRLDTNYDRKKSYICFRLRHLSQGTHYNTMITDFIKDLIENNYSFASSKFIEVRQGNKIEWIGVTNKLHGISMIDGCFHENNYCNKYQMAV